jgi:hypothetical protein
MYYVHALHNVIEPAVTIPYTLKKQKNTKGEAERYLLHEAIAHTASDRGDLNVAQSTTKVYDKKTP